MILQRSPTKEAPSLFSKPIYQYQAFSLGGVVRGPKILVVEDETDILELIEYNLVREGFLVIPAGDGHEAVQLTREMAPDAVLLDLMLPGIDGIEVCRLLKQDPITRHIPIIMVTAKGEESDIVLGLGVGASDYISKPFGAKELVARVKATLRQGALREERAAGERVQHGDLIVDSGRHEVSLAGVPVQLTPTELRLLHFLASHPGRVFSRERLLNATVGEHSIVVDRNIDVHVRSIRQKLGDYRKVIETVRGVGYRFLDNLEI
ncbi:MAG: DNA-binding response regulator [Planctomycetota bacterium]|nr:MAG: DNA-binding response regulator [Planctomycetota bacterium]